MTLMPGSGFSARTAQGGAAVVEFALVFPLLFLMMYGVIVYGYVFVLHESLVFAAQESAASAVAADATQPGHEAQMTALARNTAVRLLSWLPGDQAARVLGSNGDKVQVTFCTKGGTGCPPDTDGVVVQLVFDLNQPTPLFPVISFGGLMGISAVPPLPTQLTAQATVRI